VSAPPSVVPPDHLDLTSLPPGVTEAQARAVWRVVAEIRAGRFDALTAHAELVAGGYTAAEADVLVQEVFERLGGIGPPNTNTA
jgi:hypothetical protein